MGNHSSVALSEKRKAHKKRMTLIKREVIIHEETLQDKMDHVIDQPDHPLTEVDIKAAAVDPNDFEFSIENLVFEGGGIKGAGYAGAIRYLEELGLDKNVKRYAGASAGAMVAALLSVGHSSLEIINFLHPKYITSVLHDNPWGVCNLLPNLYSSYGWKSTKRLFSETGRALAEYTGNPDITFKEVYKTFGKEVCICVTNVNHMTVEYCHPKTTPDLPLRKAVCMSMSIPGYFTSATYENDFNTDVYVDGGLLCNYPIHCFDGWFLSMEPEDSFFEKLQPLSALSQLYDNSVRFAGMNHKTLGMQVYSDYEEDLMKSKLDQRVGALTPNTPKKSTKLYEKYALKKKQQRKTEKIHAKVMDAVNAFLKTIKKYNLESKRTIEFEELQNVFNDKEDFSDEHCRAIFGKVISAEKAFAMMDVDNSGMIEFDELMRVIQQAGVCVQSCFQGYSRQDITDLSSFLSQVQETILVNLKRLNVKASDIDRTVGINTGHIGTTDFSEMAEADLYFVEQRGYNSMKAFLQYSVVNNSLPKKESVLPKETISDN